MSDEIDTEELEDGAAVGEPAGKKRLSTRKLIMFVGLPALLIVGGLAGAFFGGLIGGGDAEEPAVVEAAQSAEGEAAEGGAAGGGTQSVFYDLPEMLVNLNTGGRASSFLKIQVSLELANPTAVTQVEQVLPRIVDNFQVYLRELRPEELSGSTGVYRLKEELLVRVNTAAQPARVRDILFKEVLIQ